MGICSGNNAAPPIDGVSRLPPGDRTAHDQQPPSPKENGHDHDGRDGVEPQVAQPTAPQAPESDADPGKQHQVKQAEREEETDRRRPAGAKGLPEDRRQDDKRQERAGGPLTTHCNGPAPRRAFWQIESVRRGASH